MHNYITEKNIKIFKTNVKCQARTLSDAIWGIILLILGNIYFYLNYFDVNNSKSIDALFFINIPSFILLAVTHLNMFLVYMYYSKDVWVTIDWENRKLEVDAKGIFKYYTFDDIKSITRYYTHRKNRKDHRKTRNGDFYYFIILLTNGENIIITSLMTDEDMIEIEGKGEVEIYPKGLWKYRKESKIINLYKKDRTNKV
jgi:hypothetical protein